MVDIGSILPFNASVETYLELEAKVKVWIEEIVPEEYEDQTCGVDSWWESLQNGVIICKLYKKLFPNSIMVIYETKPISFLRASQNIEGFLYKCEEELNIEKRVLFTVRDLYNGNNVVKVTLCLARIAIMSESLADFDGLRYSKIQISPELWQEFLNTKDEREFSIKTQLVEFFKQNQVQRPSMQTFRRQNSQIMHTFTSLTADKIKQASPGFIKLQAIVRGRIVRRLYRKLRLNATYRANIVKEMYSTEETYVSNLSLLKNLFFAGINEKGVGKNFGIHPLDVAVTMILNFSTILLEKLKEKVDNWSHRQLIGDVFFTMSDFLKIYTQYVQDYSVCIGNIYNLKDEEFNKVIKDLETNPQCHNLPFDAYLILPVQRIPRYLLLVTDLLRHTSEDHPDYQNLNKAQLKLTDIGKYVNEKQKENEAVSKVVQIANLFGKQLVNETTGITQFVRSTRKFIKEGKVKDKNRFIYIYLFNDLLLTATKSLGSFKLQSIIRVRHVKFIPENYDDGDFTIKIKKSDEFELEIFFNDEKIREEWYKILVDTQTDLKSRRQNEDEIDATQLEMNAKSPRGGVMIPIDASELADRQKKKFGISPRTRTSQSPEIIPDIKSMKNTLRNSAMNLNTLKNSSNTVSNGDKEKKVKKEDKVKDAAKELEKKERKEKKRKEKSEKKEKEEITETEAKIIEFLSGASVIDYSAPQTKPDKGWFGTTRSKTKRVASVSNLKKSMQEDQINQDIPVDQFFATLRSSRSVTQSAADPPKIPPRRLERRSITHTENSHTNSSPLSSPFSSPPTSPHTSPPPVLAKAKSRSSFLSAFKKNSEK